jgi:hypothetical protein
MYLGNMYFLNWLKHRHSFDKNDMVLFKWTVFSTYFPVIDVKDNNQKNTDRCNTFLKTG